MNIDCLESDMITESKSTGLDIYQYFNVYASTIGYCLEMWGVRQSLLYKLLVSLKGQQDLVITSWTRSIIIPSPSTYNVDINSIDPLWFDKSILEMQLLDTITLFVIISKYNTLISPSTPTSPSPTQERNSTSIQSDTLLSTISQASSPRQNDTSTIKWICVAYLVQSFVDECQKLEDENINLGIIKYQNK